MAVYTSLNKNNLEEILKNYDLGELKSYQGIEEGIENTNYLISLKKKYILTIYEKRVQNSDLPFFSNLMSKLNSLDFKCPKPIQNKDKKTITDYNGKKLMIVSYIEGKQKNDLSPDDCKQIGKEVAKMHALTKDFSFKRKNNLSIKSWRNLFENVKDKCIAIHKELPGLIETNLKDVERNWPKELPSGIIHADLFPDNIFFKKNIFNGIIDFYFSCNDFFAFEITICFNALCFDGTKDNLSFNVTKAKSFIDGYQLIRKITDEEKKYIKVLSQGAALRFLLTRVFDSLNTVKGAYVKIKDPIEYLKRLDFHKNSKNFEDYFFLMSCKIYTDGSCIGNPGKGGWAAIIINNGKKKIISGSENYTTNNRMEIIAVIKALNTIKLKQASLITDSQYVKNGIEIWIHKWKNNGWMTAEKKPVKNKDLWTKLDKIQKTKKIKWEWVKGHSSDKLNNEVDRIAREQAESVGYNEKI